MTIVLFRASDCNSRTECERRQSLSIAYTRQEMSGWLPACAPVEWFRHDRWNSRLERRPVARPNRRNTADTAAVIAAAKSCAPKPLHSRSAHKKDLPPDRSAANLAINTDPA